MAYATQADMEERFGETELAQITDLENGTTVDEDVLSAAIDDASSEMDGYIGTRHDLPLEDPPEILRMLCCDIARYHLYKAQPTETVRKRYEDAIRFLRDVASGKAGLGVTPPPVNSGGPSHSAPDRIWTRDTLGDF